MSVDLSHLPETVRIKVEQLADYIDFETMIAKGGNGYVLVGNNTVLGRRVAVKFYYWGNGDHAEPALLAQLESEHVLKVYHAEHINEQDAFFMTPFCENGDVDDLIERERIGPVAAVDIILQLAAGVSYLHGQRFLHRDLKPSNVFCLGDGKFVIGDFGSVVQQNEEGWSQTLTRHSLLYRPPEELDERRSYEQGDIYQLGLVLYQLLGGHLPYDEAAWLTNKQLSQYEALSGFEKQHFAQEVIEGKIARGKLVNCSTLPSWVPRSLQSVVRKCCKLNRADRFETAAALVATLNNIRGGLPDWRIGADLVLHRGRALFRITTLGGHHTIEKKIRGAAAWRRERRLNPTSLQEAVRQAEEL